ncbi:hypothetical protein ABID19_001229 [Mesorhizobium robiniae]|uniref:Nuclease-associated modular DNA-binding 1 domain-containing protein n=1 Tax=Mesorhizobium robiniae TaxID=559315 RepID=A0ABV2GJL3_9HYPH
MSDATKLWVNVILLAAQDALKDKQERKWFRLSNADFIEVCSLAGLDPEAVRDRATDAFHRYDEAEAAGVKFKAGSKIRGCATKPAIKYLHDGKSLTVSEWSRLIGIKDRTIRARLRAGYSIAETLDPASKPKSRTFNRAHVRKPRRFILPGRQPNLHSINGVSKSLAQWAKEYGVSYAVLTRRLRLGATLQHALNPPQSRAKVHTINGVGKTYAEWAKHIGISIGTLHQRMSHGRTLAEAVAMGGPRGNRGVVDNFPRASGTGGGSVAQDRAQIEFSANPEKTSP